jgi:hypothetical protein
MEPWPHNQRFGSNFGPVKPDGSCSWNTNLPKIRRNSGDANFASGAALEECLKQYCGPSIDLRRRRRRFLLANNSATFSTNSLDLATQNGMGRESRGTGRLADRVSIKGQKVTQAHFPKIRKSRRHGAERKKWYTQEHEPEWEPTRIHKRCYMSGRFRRARDHLGWSCAGVIAAPSRVGSSSLFM